MVNGDRPMFLTEICHRNGCPALAHVGIKICIPPKGAPGYEPFTLIVPGLAVCDRHFAEEKREMQTRYLTKLVRGLATEMMRPFGAEPDFEGAWLQSVHVMSSEFLKARRASRDPSAGRIQA